ncbi:MAG: Lrp/AsnC ligand binding domain-containing protein [Candidatus Helarchaeota archaeon]
MIKAYVLLTLGMGHTKEVLKKLKAIEEIESIAVVAGVYDIILTVQVTDLEALYELTYIKLEIEDIKETTTFIVEKEIIPKGD